MLKLSHEDKVNLLRRILVDGERQIDLFNSSYYIFFKNYKMFAFYINRIQREKRTYNEAVYGSVSNLNFKPTITFRENNRRAMEDGKNEPYYKNEMDYGKRTFERVTIQDLSFTEQKILINI